MNEGEIVIKYFSEKFFRVIKRNVIRNLKTKIGESFQNLFAVGYPRDFELESEIFLRQFGVVWHFAVKPDI